MLKRKVNKLHKLDSFVVFLLSLILSTDEISNCDLIAPFYFYTSYLDQLHTNIQHLHFKQADIQIKYEHACPQRQSAAFHYTSS